MSLYCPNASSSSRTQALNLFVSSTLSENFFHLSPLQVLHFKYSSSLFFNNLKSIFT